MLVPATASAQPLPFNLKGRFVQGGYAMGQTTPGAQFWVDGVQRGVTSDKGWFYVGLDRDAPAACLIEVQNTTGGRDSTRITVKPGTYDIQKVNGLPQQTVTPTDPAILARIKRDSDLKNLAFTSHDFGDGFRTGFIYPLRDFRVSGRFGNQRVLNGTPTAPHYGFDMAAPAGTHIRAPAQGLVVLAEPDLFYDGGLTLIDHGQGLISMYLHQSKVLVKKGDRVTQAQIIGHVGAKGRATGPHLCWRLKWGDRRMDPSLMVG
ncbi:peptidase family M23 family protein [Asticcacaulis biprosthecium C19]|uniref:Peptidase family M23 family protein n=1 Tax=Asticcacaulis biprosthecium C19 TaxID=715226 RepID=F4QS46_9CAUL|nr:M23 family metallopeptidase [Asticcacaulis biprosthecium]EGF89566.1 peptidase family M23 family protein [Asticcacaulis biprosthecium C19]